MSLRSVACDGVASRANVNVDRTFYVFQGFCNLIPLFFLVELESRPLYPRHITSCLPFGRQPSGATWATRPFPRYQARLTFLSTGPWFGPGFAYYVRESILPSLALSNLDFRRWAHGGHDYSLLIKIPRAFCDFCFLLSLVRSGSWVCICIPLNIPETTTFFFFGKATLGVAASCIYPV